jgi:hypothetical protein
MQSKKIMGKKRKNRGKNGRQKSRNPAQKRKLFIVKRYKKNMKKVCDFGAEFLLFSHTKNNEYNNFN